MSMHKVKNALLLLYYGSSQFTASNAMSPASLRVVSYNVLSSHLASPSYYSSLEPEDLEASARLKKVKAKLEQEMTSTDRSTIFCLQEVSYDWAGDLHSMFASKGYHVVTGLYGRPFNGYMGVLTAYPTDTLDTVKVDISRLSDTVKWPKKPKESGVLSTVKSYLTPPLKLLGILGNEPESHWSLAQRRFNVLITTKLKDKKTNTEFCVGNYHMPCCFYAPMVMTMHADMCAKHVQDVAADAPCIVAGDFNLKPGDAGYRLITTGTVDESDPAYPTPPDYDMSWEWKPTTKGMRSAYAHHSDDGTTEPDFTNYARVREDEPFIDTLDYIFVSDTVDIVDCLPLPHRKDFAGPIPNAEEPSDHIMVAANLDVR